MVGILYKIAAWSCIAVLMVLGLGGAALADPLEETQSQRDRILDAEASYAFDDFHIALDMLAELEKADNLKPAVRFDLLVLKGRCLVRLGQVELAAESFCSAHALNSKWRPDLASLEPDEAVAYATATNACGGHRAWWKRPIMWMVGGGVIASAMLLTGDGAAPQDPDQDLPGFPALPGGH